MKEIDGAVILVVEDEPGVLRAVQRILAPTHQVVPAQGARDAESLLREQAFDIAIVDIQLPDGSGYEVNRVIHDLDLDTDVILMTGSTSRRDQKLFQALEDDAFYFLFKPFDRRVLIALVDRCLRLRRLQRENLQHLERLARDQEKVGHGLPAAMYAGMLHSTVDAACRFDPNPLTVFDRLLEGLDFFASNSGASLIYGHLAADGLLRYMNAGHPPALLQRAAASPLLERLGATGPKLLSAAIIRELPRGSDEVKLEPGDRVLFYTDGVSEAESPDQREWGIDGVEGAFRAAGHDQDGTRRSAEATLSSFLHAFRAHCAGRPVGDDVTVVLVERLELS